MQDLREALIALIEPLQPVTVRQVFYLAVAAWLIAKTETEYDKTIVRVVKEMRMSGDLPWDWIADYTRWMRKPRTYTTLEAALAETARLYRRSLWQDQDAYVEIWLEKEALAGVLYPMTDLYDVPLMVSKGYASVTFLYEAAQVIRATGKPAFIYYFGDHDPSGLDIPVNIERQLRAFSQGADITFERVAVQPWQIADWQLPARPTKKTDSRSKHFTGDSVEVDAIPPDLLRTMVERCIVQHLDERRLRVAKLAEAHERGILALFGSPVILEAVRQYVGDVPDLMEHAPQPEPGR
jgi:hypothetical protein